MARKENIGMMGMYLPSTPFDYIINRPLLREIIRFSIIDTILITDVQQYRVMLDKLVNLYEKYILFNELMIEIPEAIEDSIFTCIFKIYALDCNEDDEIVTEDAKDAVSMIYELIVELLELNGVSFYPDDIDLTGYEYYELSIEKRVIIVRCLADKRIVEYHRGKRTKQKSSGHGEDLSGDWGSLCTLLD